MSYDQTPDQDDAGTGPDGRRDAAASPKAHHPLSTGRRGFFRFAMLSGVEQLERLGRGLAREERSDGEAHAKPAKPPAIRRPDDRIARSDRATDRGMDESAG
jgi:hypothetical protein